VDRKAHWEHIYETKTDHEVSWFEPDPRRSLELILVAIVAGGRSVIDIGGGTSLLVDHLLEAGIGRVAVLDVSEAALRRTRERLGDLAGAVTWLCGDVTDLPSVGNYDVWHDRAVFHFLTSESDRRQYATLAEATVPAGGHIVMATFGPNGPTQCSGLEVVRYDAEGITRALGPAFTLLQSAVKIHDTPGGGTQEFLYSLLRRNA